MTEPTTSNAELTIVLPTVGRRQSLLETLAALGPLSRPEDVEVIVVDNAPQPELSNDVLSGLQCSASRLLHEPSPGKGHALNRAMRAGVGRIVAILDDDMAPTPGWADSVIASVNSRPDFDIFGGRSHVVWPAGAKQPAWADHWVAQAFAFSVIDLGEKEREMWTGAHPSGNHFWFRRSVLADVPSFPAVWATEPEFIIKARNFGHRGIFVPEVICGHRIQPGLIDTDVLLERAERYGRARVHFSVQPAKSRLRAILRPLRWRVRRLKWRLRDHWARLQSDATGVPERAKARMNYGFCDELLRLAKHDVTPRS